MTIEMNDYATVWLDFSDREVPDRWVVDCSDCGQLMLTGSSRALAVRIANMHNTARHSSPGGEVAMTVCRGCGKEIETWREWFEGDCKVTPAGHSLTREEWMLLPGWDNTKNLIDNHITPWFPNKEAV